jgi:hypothetical protein
MSKQFFLSLRARKHIEDVTEESSHMTILVFRGMTIKKYYKVRTAIICTLLVVPILAVFFVLWCASIQN